MTASEYAEIARAARTWQSDQNLPPHRRGVAQSLYELASQLTDPDFGCPSENRAVMVMYHYLLSTTSGRH